MSHPDRDLNRQGALLSSLQPLRRRVPLTMMAVLAVIVAAMLWLGYRRVYDSVIAAEVTRIRASARQLTANLDVGIGRIRSEDGKLAHSPELMRAMTLLATSRDRAAA